MQGLVCARTLYPAMQTKKEEERNSYPRVKFTSTCCHRLFRNNLESYTHIFYPKADGVWPLNGRLAFNKRDEATHKPRRMGSRIPEIPAVSRI